MTFRVEDWWGHLEPLQILESFEDVLSHLGIQSTTGQYEISRRQVFELSEQANDAEGALRTYLGIILWGCGTTEMTRTNSLAALGRNFRTIVRPGLAPRIVLAPGGTLRSGIEEILWKAMQLARSNPSEAFNYLHGESGVTNQIPRLGSSFGTKVLYFGAFSKMAEHEIKPLILDSRVIKSLNALRIGRQWDARPSRDQYAEYLLLASNLAATNGCTADAIEMALYSGL